MHRIAPIYHPPGLARARAGHRWKLATWPFRAESAAVPAVQAIWLATVRTPKPSLVQAQLEAGTLRLETALL